VLQRHTPTYTDQYASRHAVQRAAHLRPEQGVRAAVRERPSYSSALLGNRALGGRGNGPVQIALMTEMQQAHGNRAMQRFLQRSPARQGALPVQRCGGEVHAGCTACGGDKLNEEQVPVARSVAVQRLTAEEKQENLTSAKYAGEERLEKAFDNSPAMHVGESGKPVRLVQEGLVADGFAMPKSTKKDGSMDGKFGGETHSVLTQFQTKHKLGFKDGAVGRQTMGKLDELAQSSAPDNKPPSGFEIDGKSFRGEVDKVYFLRGSAEIPDIEEKLKVAFKSTPPTRPLTLRGLVSEDEDPKLAVQRIKAVKAELAKGGHTGPIIEDAQPGASLGRSDYRNVRAVQIVTAESASKEPNCKVTPPTTPCNAEFEAALKDGSGKAKSLIASSVSALDSPTPATRAIFARFYKDTAQQTISDVQTNLRNISKQVDHLSSPTGHDCATPCSNTCRTPIAFVEGEVGPATKMTLCAKYLKESSDERARVMVHEASHVTDIIGGKPLHGSEDLSTGNQRMFEFLTKAEAIKNADTYALFVMESNGTQLPGSTPPEDKDLTAGTGMSVQEKAVARRTFAFIQGRLIKSRSELNFLYDNIKDSKAPAKAWSNTHAEGTMSIVAPLFDLTVPPTVPTMKDQVSVAGITDRVTRMNKPMFFSVDMKKVTSGTTKWISGSDGPEKQVDLGPDFFDLGLTAGEGHTSLLMLKLAEAMPQIPVDHEAKYVTLTAALEKR
jgi:hypothetical protein